MSDVRSHSTHRSSRTAALLDERRVGWSLPGALYHDPEVFEAELELIWHREWVFAGHVCELAAPGDLLTLQVGRYPLIVVRGVDSALRALHNVCRHRGSVICEVAHGRVGRRLTCPYHQWSYDLAGRHAGGRSIDPTVDSAELSLGTAHVATIGGLVFVCVADEPPDVEPLRATVEPYLAPFDLERATVAHRSTMVERGNWKLVMENNRECYHCVSAHPELSVSFPPGAQHAGGGSPAELAELDAFVERAEACGLPSRFAASADHQYRVMRMPLAGGGARSMTLDGAPASDRRFRPLDGDPDVGDLLLYHYPSTWNHFVADHAVTFRLLPLSPTTSELHTTWLVPSDGADVDHERLTAVWMATNVQDATLVERTQRGTASPAYRPGPYSPVEEDGVVQFIEWYAARMVERLQ